MIMPALHGESHMADKSFGISTKLLVVGCFICSLAGLLFVVLDQFGEDQGTFTVVGIAVVCVGLAMGAIGLMRKDAPAATTGQGGGVQGKS
jgi:uncharacterized YccA/Bax inhibitor family protein